MLPLQKYAVDTAELTTKLKASQAETAEWKISHSVLKTRVDKADQKVYDDVDARGVRVVKKAMQKVKIGVDTCIRVAYFRTHGNLMVLNDVYEQAFEDVSEGELEFDACLSTIMPYSHLVLTPSEVFSLLALIMALLLQSSLFSGDPGTMFTNSESEPVER